MWEHITKGHGEPLANVMSRKGQGTFADLGEHSFKLTTQGGHRLKWL